MAEMPRQRWPYLQCATTRHKKTVWYVRLQDAGRTRVRLRADYGTPEFRAEYEAALKRLASVGQGKAQAGSLAWAVELYRRSTAWSELSAATRRQRENILKHVLARCGSAPLRQISRADIVGGREDRAAAPAAARHFIETMRGIFLWALDAELVAADPTAGVKTPRRKTDGHLPWTAADLAAFEARWPLGTRERLIYAVLLYTGLRRGDAARVGRPHVRDGVIRIQTEKTGEWVAIRIARGLAAAIDVGPVGELTFIASEAGRPLRKESLGNMFRDACRAAGVDKSAHGLRKNAATRAAENGATEAELEAMFGWRGGRMASLYTRAANRERLAIGAGDKLETRTAMGAPSGEVGRTLKKSE
ncbi:tyrosine-type recombinase/integrase [Methylocystis sp. SC2]|uniref:tyrosine-type recombinase/integrase n=1 Tax=Methylocystis sp. (strain SC2) TaxID=187303 RepID=UPI00027AEF30|nr:tyrosine-type recombinase/integrase [Methylocystis sp. SC2]CCJ07030.1 Phage-related integrase/recombinase [Methylocystis sp. SC2]